MEVTFIISIVLIILGVYLSFKDFKYVLHGVTLIILGECMLSISLFYMI